MDPQPKPNNISNDDGDNPAKNTRAKWMKLTQEVILTCMELTDTHINTVGLANIPYEIVV